jgi:hypothetical protein
MNTKERIAVAVTVLAVAVSLLVGGCGPKAKVEVITQTTSAMYIGEKKPGQVINYMWRETCNGTVTNTGDDWAFHVRVSTRFSRGCMAYVLVSPSDLQPGDKGSFGLYGDTLYGTNKSSPPKVTASPVKVYWE